MRFGIVSGRRIRVAERRHVLVTDASRGSAVAFIRSLGQRGWRVTAADFDPTSAGFRSRYTTRRLVYPRPTDHPDAVVEAILEAVARDGIDLVIPVTDEVGLPLADARASFEGITTLALPEPEALAMAHDKGATIALAERLGVPIPATRSVPAGRDALEAAAALGYPVVVKPIVSRALLGDGTIGSYAVTYAADPEELRRRMEAIGATAVLLQRWLPGVGLGVELLMDRGRPLAAFQHRRIHEVPPTGGASALRESVDLDPDLYDHAIRMLGELRWTGLAMVEFRRGPDGIGHLMEINGRVWGSLPLAVRAGMDFPSRLADLLLDGAPAADAAVATDYRSGVRARNLRLEVGWIGAVLLGRRRYPYLPWPRRRAALAAIGGLLDPRIADDHLSLSDPGPGLALLATIPMQGIGRLRHDRG
jgi:predicted ATP-grasp superfamily ATP-dependent carboligase